MKEKRNNTNTKKKIGSASNKSRIQQLNTVVHQQVKTAKYRPTADGVRVRHSEYVGELTTGSTTVDYSLLFGEPINPGNQNLFPWLHQVATRYEKWKIHSMKIEFIPASSAVVDGVAIMYIDYDPQDQGATTLVQAMNMYRSKPVSVFAYNSIDYNKKEDSYRWYYTDTWTSANPSQLVPNSYPGWVRVACSKVPATKTLGFLKITYDIELSVPQIQTSKYQLDQKQSMMAQYGESVLDVNFSWQDTPYVFLGPLSSYANNIIRYDMNPALDGQLDSSLLLPTVTSTSPLINQVFSGFQGDVRLTPGAIPGLSFERREGMIELTFTKPGTYSFKYNVTKFGQDVLGDTDMVQILSTPYVSAVLPSTSAPDIKVNYDGYFGAGKAGQTGGPPPINSMVIEGTIYLGASCFRGVVTGVAEGILDGVAVAIGFNPSGSITGNTWYSAPAGAICRTISANVVRLATSRVVDRFLSRSILPTIHIVDEDGREKYTISQTEPLVSKIVNNRDQSSPMRKRIVCDTYDRATSKLVRSTDSSCDSVEKGDERREFRNTLEQVKFDQYFSPERRG